MKSAENTSRVPPTIATSASCENIFLCLNALYAPTGRRHPNTARRIYRGLILLNMETFSTTVSTAPSTTSSGVPARLPRMLGTNAIRTIAGTPISSHHLNLPEYRHMHIEPTPAITRMAVNGDAVRVRMNSRIAIPTIKMSHPDRPSL